MSSDLSNVDEAQENANVEETQEEESKELTLDEWKALQVNI